MKDLLLAAINSELSRRKISNLDIADKLCVSAGTISRWLRRGTTLKNLDTILVAFGISVDKITFK